MFTTESGLRLAVITAVCFLVGCNVAVGSRRTWESQQEISKTLYFLGIKKFKKINYFWNFGKNLEIHFRKGIEPLQGYCDL